MFALWIYFFKKSGLCCHPVCSLARSIPLTDTFKSAWTTQCSKGPGFPADANSCIDSPVSAYCLCLDSSAQSWRSEPLPVSSERGIRRHQHREYPFSSFPYIELWILHFHFCSQNFLLVSWQEKRIFFFEGVSNSTR